MSTSHFGVNLFLSGWISHLDSVYCITGGSLFSDFLSDSLVALPFPGFGEWASCGLRSGSKMPAMSCIWDLCRSLCGVVASGLISPGILTELELTGALAEPFSCVGGSPCVDVFEFDRS